MSCNRLAHLLIPFVEQDLSEFERYQLTAHLAHCSECQDEVELIEALYLVSPEPPSWSPLDDAINGALHEQTAPRHRVHLRTLGAYLTLFALILTWARLHHPAQIGTGEPITVLVPAAPSAPVPTVQFRSASYVPKQPTQIAKQD